MPQHPDTVYSPSAKARPYPVYAQAGPNQSHEERLVSEALAASQTPGHILQNTVRPPLPRTELFPPRFGYDREQIGIRDVINVNTRFSSARIDYHTYQSGFSASSYPSIAIY